KALRDPRGFAADREKLRIARRRNCESEGESGRQSGEGADRSVDEKAAGVGRPRPGSRRTTVTTRRVRQGRDTFPSHPGSRCSADFSGGGGSDSGSGRCAKSQGALGRDAAGSGRAELGPGSSRDRENQVSLTGKDRPEPEAGAC